MNKPPPDCTNCQHFYVTWDPVAPRGCRAYGFKCRSLPSLEVKRASGVPCLKYLRKPKVLKKARKKAAKKAVRRKQSRRTP